MATAQQLYQSLANDYMVENAESASIYEQACQPLPGGNTRTVLYYHPFPLCIVKGQGSIITDADGHEYVDLLGEYTAGLYGHSDPTINKAIIDAVQQGVGFGAQNKNEMRLAQLVRERFRSIAQLRFTNSGTEANLMALALAATVTGRKSIVVFDGGYHGGLLSWKGGKNSPINVPYNFLIGRYNDLATVETFFKHSDHAKDIAAVIVEPMIGSGGCIPGDLAFLQGLRRLTQDAGALLIYDEVMTSRLRGGHGLQADILDVSQLPDLTTLGKYIGGGMSFGAFGGKEELMSRFDPRRPDCIAHAGTFNNNVLTMAAGVAGLEHVFTEDKHIELDKHAEQLQLDLRKVCKGTIMQWTGLGSIQAVHFVSKSWQHIECPNDVADADMQLMEVFHLWLLKRGYHVGRRGFIALSFAITAAQYEGFKAAVRDFVAQHRYLIQA